MSQPHTRYLVEKRIGSGGMADVFVAQVQGADRFTRRVVLKRLRGAQHAEAEIQNMFLREAHLASRFRHPNLVPALQLIELSGGEHVIVLEHLEGWPLSSILEAARYRGGTLPQSTATFIVFEVAKGLAYAHGLRGDDGESLGLVHRDVSPGNVFVTSDGVSKLLDFGIAKTTQSKKHSTLIKGTPFYIAPEQARLQPVDSRTDVFSLGCVYYELLSGLTFYDGGDPVAMVARASSLTREDAFARVSDMGFSESVARVLRNMLSPDPGERYANARDLLEDLERVLIRSGKVERAKDVRELCLEFMEASVILHEDGLRNASPPGVMERDLQDKLDHALSSKTSSPPSNTQSSTLRRAAAAVALLSVVAIAVYSVYRPTEALDTAREAEIPDVTIGEITLLGSEPESQADSKPPELLAERIRRTAPEKAGKRKRRYERTGMVSLTSEQPMQVYWRGRRIGNTPLSDFRLPTGSQTLRIVNRGEFVDREIRVHVKAGESVSKSVTLTRGSLAIRADPWADVYINEQRVGTTPMPALRLVEGLYVLDFRNPATGKSEKKRIRVSSGREQVVRVNLN